MLNGIFTNPAFGMESLTASILQIPFMPSAVRDLGIFKNEGVPTTTVDVEFDSILMQIIPSTPRGGPAANYRRQARQMRSFKIPHFPLEDTILPAAVQNVRLFGSNNQLQSAMATVNKALTGMAMSHDLTLEYGSVGAVKGVIYDSDGSTVIYNLFNEFGIQQASFDFTLGDTTTNITHICLQIKRKIEVALGGTRASMDHVHCFCGQDFFDAFVAHPEVQEAYKLWQKDSQFGSFARTDNRTGFPFAGIFFENYIGSSPSGVEFFPPSEAHFFPVGVPNLFITNFAPADMWETVNTIGLPRYARGEPMKMGRGIELYTESNALSYCTRPAALVLGTTSSLPAGIGNGDVIG